MEQQNENTPSTPKTPEPPLAALIGGFGATICGLIAAYQLANMRVPILSGAGTIIFGLIGFVGALSFAQSQRKQGGDASATPSTPPCQYDLRHLPPRD